MISRKFTCSVAFTFALLPFDVIGNYAEAQTSATDSVSDIFARENRNQLVMDIEAAIAQAQAKYDIIPQRAADQIAAHAGIQYAPLAAIKTEYKLTNHRMVALLNVWRRSLDPGAANYLHYGVTTVDIYDTVRVLQIRASLNVLLADMVEIEDRLIVIATTHRDTVMVGRTIGQHALPITFGKKVVVWLAQNRRNIDRLQELQIRLESSGVLKGAVGTHLGLGPKGVLVEREVSAKLGLRTPEAADWHGARDVFAEYGQVLALISKSYASIGAEIFRLSTTDIGELSERQATSNVGSSTMPHKKNPRWPERVIHHGRKIPRLAEVLLDDVENSFERDNTSGPNRIIEEISLEAAKMMRDTKSLLKNLRVDKDRMRENLARTDGMIMAQRLMLALSKHIDRTLAEEHVRKAAQKAIDTKMSFRAALLEDPVLAPYLNDTIDELLNPETYLGLAREQVDLSVADIKRRRAQPK
ncbi:MAG: hypothetical protein COA69_11045 [Robiginitomaculum sp.]|nr:MAG: hypothetical protein COA69_11045 [Robiginitomaculum sp.]